MFSDVSDANAASLLTSLMFTEYTCQLARGREREGEGRVWAETSDGAETLGYKVRVTATLMNTFIG